MAPEPGKQMERAVIFDMALMASASAYSPLRLVERNDPVTIIVLHSLRIKYNNLLAAIIVCPKGNCNHVAFFKQGGSLIHELGTPGVKKLKSQVLQILAAATAGVVIIVVVMAQMVNKIYFFLVAKTTFMMMMNTRIRV